jgi:hypothetical protein
LMSCWRDRAAVRARVRSVPRDRHNKQRTLRQRTNNKRADLPHSTRPTAAQHHRLRQRRRQRQQHHHGLYHRSTDRIMARSTRVWGHALGSSPPPSQQAAACSTTAATRLHVTSGGAAAARSALVRRPLHVHTEDSVVTALSTPDALGIRSPSRTTVAPGDHIRSSVAAGECPPSSPLGTSKWDAVDSTYKAALQ